MSKDSYKTVKKAVHSKRQNCLRVSYKGYDEDAMKETNTVLST